MSNKSIKMLLVIEDNPGDVRLLREMFNEQGLRNTKLTHVERMSEAEKYLAGHAVDIILLDLNLPKMDGREALAHIEEDDRPKRIPIVILNRCSEAEVDNVKSHQCDADSYLSKPAQLDAFESLVKSINDFWLTKAKLPRQRQSA